MAKEAGSLLDPPIRPRAWVIRLPGAFLGPDGQRITGSFQTVVVAASEDMAWELAMDCDVWEQLPFPVKNVQIFPKDPLSNGANSSR
jgi:hypothetical protein